MSSEIILVSGLPRSGTSLMMQMLEQGGVEVVTDHVRSADIDNPRGYYEFEKVKRAFTLHLQKLRQWLERQPSMRTLYVPYHDLVQQPEEQVKRVCEFLG